MDLPLLSVFPGADLLGRGFEAAGFCVVRAPDSILGGDIRDFHTFPGWCGGVIGGPPCQDFSRRRRAAPTGEGVAMLREFSRVVIEAWPAWFLMENVPGVPDVSTVWPAGLLGNGPAFAFQFQRFNLTARECGGKQHRIRTFQFGFRDRLGPLVLPRPTLGTGGEPACIASEAQQIGRRSFADFCELQGLPRDFDLPALSIGGKYRAVGNGVPVYMARRLAEAIRGRTGESVRLCACGCARPIGPDVSTFGPSCRKRLERQRKRIRGDGEPFEWMR